jgi:multidrug transporter EmrE-like cation transporter
MEVLQVIGFLAVAACWGCTNPLLNKGGNGISNKDKQPGVIGEVTYLLTNWRFMAPFVVNQLGSVLYNVVLSMSDVSLAQPLCNSLAMVFTAVTARILGEEPLTVNKVLGMILVCTGVTVCCYSKL